MCARGQIRRYKNEAQASKKRGVGGRHIYDSNAYIDASTTTTSSSSSFYPFHPQTDSSIEQVQPLAVKAGY